MARPQKPSATMRITRDLVRLLPPSGLLPADARGPDGLPANRFAGGSPDDPVRGRSLRRWSGIRRAV